MKYSTEYMRPAEAFSRGFWGGIGFFCGFMVLNIVVGLAIIAGLMSMGLLGAAATIPMGTPRSAYSPPAETSTDTPSRSVRTGNR